MPTTAERIVDWWFNEVGPEGWFGGGEALDADCRRRHERDWEAGRRGAFDWWTRDPVGSLGLILLLDQLPRNMFRGTAKAFQSDEQARRVAKRAVDRGHDMQVDPTARPFFYLPLEHSEWLVDQDRAVRLSAARLKHDAQFLLHARAHREVIRRFGRFPFRNDALGREWTEAEQAFMDEGGYGGLVERMKEAA